MQINEVIMLLQNIQEKKGNVELKFCVRGQPLHPHMDIAGNPADINADVALHMNSLGEVVLPLKTFF